MLCFASNYLAICIKLPRNLRQIRMQLIKENEDKSKFVQTY